MDTSDLIARMWTLDLRQKSFIEIGGTAPAAEIWQGVRRRIETDAITNRGVALRLPPDQARRVRDKARRIAEYRVTVDAYAIV